MAEGRMLSKRISRSDKLAALPSDTERMFYSWLIPYLDVEGRLEADPKLLKADIAPLLDHITPKKIEDILVILYNIGLIVLYEVNKKQYLQLVKFDDNQKNLRKDRETPSKIPKPPAEVRQKSGEAPVEVPPKINISLSLREDKEKAADAFILPSWIPEETWNAYLKLRDKKKAAKTDYALNLIIKELNKINTEYGHDRLAVLNKSIKSGWTDVYPLKEGGNNGNKRGNSAGGFGIQKEYEPDPKPTVGEIERNQEQLKKLTAKITHGSDRVKV
jgi:hypothetical protein